jgi:uncharacterized protein YeaO (DUF488 family)
VGGDIKNVAVNNPSKAQPSSNIRVRRIYDSASKDGSLRILVDRLWPRGLTKQAAAIDLWLKDIAPTNELRRWYGHDPEKWPEFKKRYFQELKGKVALLKTLRQKISEGPVTLLYSSTETEINNAAALAEFLKKDEI